MKAIISRSIDNGWTFPNVGTNNQMLISHCKTEKRIIEIAENYCRNSMEQWGRRVPYRIQLFTDDGIFRDPIKVIYG